VRPGLVAVKTYHDTILDYATHPEPKSAGADGKPCDRSTIGLLARRPVIPTIVRHIGKESNRLEEAQLGLLEDSDEALNRYSDAKLSVFRELAVPILLQLGVRETARRAKLGLGSVSAGLSGRSVPRPSAIARYLDVAADHAGGLLAATGVQPVIGPEAMLRQALSLTD
jgi:hypothetical protein